jgi:hypothetical protein
MAFDARMEQHIKRARWPKALRSCLGYERGCLSFSSAPLSRTEQFFEFSEWPDSATHDLGGDALHAARSAEEMLPAGAAQFAVARLLCAVLIAGPCCAGGAK